MAEITVRKQGKERRMNDYSGHLLVICAELGMIIGILFVFADNL